MTELLPLNTSRLPVKLRVDDYLLLDRSGAFDAYRKTELIEGDVYFMNAQHRPHALAKTELYDALRDGLRATGSPLRPLIEASVALSEFDAPEPDIVLTSEPRGEGLVPLASVALIVEVSDTTVKDDLTRKAVVYARAHVPEYWVVDVNARVIHKMWLPEDEAYAECKVVTFGQPVKSESTAGLIVETTTL
ncbi:MAG: Uma2 family endonuclease [Candidatus Sphingomonas phytovorans]|nr:Uma2 family endonuclease [Sphingomonas sp.]WEK01434.1 MAG: Uma2 family endonuclease [Sphingomonas sp.]